MVSQWFYRQNHLLRWNADLLRYENDVLAFYNQINGFLAFVQATFEAQLFPELNVGIRKSPEAGQRPA